MKIRELFAKPVDRPIEGVIKADDDTHLALEVDEYIVTNEVAKHIGNFFEAYNNQSSESGVWISGFFGSGKSHLLKMLSLVLENREIDGTQVGGVFSEKIDDAILKAEVLKAIKVPSKSILFNIDQKSDIIRKQESDAILSVFLKVFNEMQGFYPKQPYIAQFERDLTRKGQYEDFKAAFEKEAGEPWEQGRDTAHGLDAEPFARANASVSGASIDEGLKLLDRYDKNFKFSIEDFANMVKEYIDTQGPNFRLNFFVDEVGQFIADNSKLMVNLQTMAESLATKCRGRSWIMVTSQEDMSKVVGEMAKIHTSNDFSKIQDRFKTLLPLTSKDVSEVIQKRLLDKNMDNPTGIDTLQDLYDREKSNFRTLFGFGDGSRAFQTYSGREAFLDSYPFVPYQFDLFQLSIKALSRHNAFTGKHASVGERSMLGVFQEVAKKIADEPCGHLASFDLMFEGIRSVIKSEHQSAILMAERNLSNKLAQRILKTLFLVKYLKEFKGTPRNIAILVIDRFDIDLNTHEKEVREALNILEQNTYVQRTGEIYEFLTDDEKDVENEIKATEIEDSAINELAARVLYDEIIRATKIRHEDNQQDYTFSRKLDESLIGLEHELVVNIISPFHEFHGDEATIISQSMGKPELLLLLSSDQRLLSDLTLFVKTDKYIRQSHKSTMADSRRPILADKGQQNIQRKANILQKLEHLLSEAKAIVNGTVVPGLSGDARSRVTQAFHHLIRFAYPNLKMLKVIYREDSVRKILLEQGDDLFRHDDGTLSESERELFTDIHRHQVRGELPTVSSILKTFGRRPYGWYQAATLANLAKLFMRSKIELRADSNILDKDGVLSHLTNNRQFTNTVVFLQEEFDSQAVQKLKSFHQEFFDESNIGTEAKDVAQRFQEKLKAEISLLEEICKREQSFPFVRQLNGPITKLKAWVEKPYSVYLKELPSFEDEWMDAKEDTIDPIRKFVHGQQAKVYQEIHDFLRENKANLSDIAPEDANKLEEFFSGETPYRGNALQQAKTLTDKLRSQVETELSAARKDATGKICRMAKSIEALEGFTDLNAVEKGRIFKISDDVLEIIHDAPLLAIIRDKLHTYMTDGYPRQLTILNEINAGKAKSEGIEEQAAQFVSRHLILIDYPKGVIENKADLKAYLTAVEKAYLNELKANRKISL